VRRIQLITYGPEGTPRKKATQKQRLALKESAAAVRLPYPTFGNFEPPLKDRKHSPAMKAVDTTLYLAQGALRDSGTLVADAMRRVLEGDRQGANRQLICAHLGISTTTVSLGEERAKIERPELRRLRTTKNTEPKVTPEMLETAEEQQKQDKRLQGLLPKQFFGWGGGGSRRQQRRSGSRNFSNPPNNFNNNRFNNNGQRRFNGNSNYNNKGNFKKGYYKNNNSKKPGNYNSSSNSNNN
jgi:hypothetical protein